MELDLDHVVLLSSVTFAAFSFVPNLAIVFKQSYSAHGRTKGIRIPSSLSLGTFVMLSLLQSQHITLCLNFSPEVITVSINAIIIHTFTEAALVRGCQHLIKVKEVNFEEEGGKQVPVYVALTLVSLI